MGGMIDVIKPLNLKFKHQFLRPDNIIFQLHYKFTVSILMVSSLLVTSKQFFGDPIKCISDRKKEEAALDLYCWMRGTYVSRNPQSSAVVGKNAVSQGIYPYTDHDEKYYYMYYQWVFLFLAVQAIMFYAPRFIWKMFEGGKLQLLVNELNTILEKPEKWNETRRKCLVRYFVEVNDRNIYAYRFAFCELVNFLNVVFQLLLLNLFIGGSFLDYGSAFASATHNTNDPNNEDPMEWMFPKTTKCTFRFFGSSGTLQNLELLCVLPLNVINEKVFALLWFWYVILTVISGIALLYRITLFCIPSLRAYSLMNQTRFVPKFQAMNIAKKFDIGDWFMLSNMGKCVNPTVFKDLLLDIDNEFDKRKPII